MNVTEATQPITRALDGVDAETVGALVGALHDYLLWFDEASRAGYPGGITCLDDVIQAVADARGDE